MIPDRCVCTIPAELLEGNVCHFPSCQTHHGDHIYTGNFPLSCLCRKIYCQDLSFRLSILLAWEGFSQAATQPQPDRLRGKLPLHLGHCCSQHQYH